MVKRISKDELARRLAARMDSGETTATRWVDSLVEMLYEIFKAGEAQR